MPHDSSSPVCSICSRELELSRIGVHRCLHCGIALTSEDSLCLRCRELESPGPAGRGLFLYRGAIRVLLQRYKFDGIKSLSILIADEIFHELESTEKEAVIVPIPSSRKSRHRNGWGHMEQVAACLEKKGLTVCPKLLVRNPGKEQKKLNRQGREENSKSVYRHSGILTGKKCLLIDDVRTTGASLRAASAALEAGGAQVTGWIVFAID